MSGAEVIAFIGLAANVIEFIQAGRAVYNRVKEISKSIKGAPKEIEDLLQTLDLVLQTLESLNEGARKSVGPNGRVEIARRSFEKAAIDKCLEKGRELVSYLDRYVCKSDEGRVKKWWRAYMSIRGKNDVEDLQQALDRLLQLVGLQLQSKQVWALFEAQKSEQRNTSQLQKIEEIMESNQMKLNAISLLNNSGRTTDVKYLIPYGENENYVERKSVSDKLGKLLRIQNGYQSRAALYGLGGVGKSQIALKYAYILKEARQCSVFWIQASNPTRTEESFLQIAQVFEIPGRENTRLNVMELVRQWLVESYERNWLMVIDNVDLTMSATTSQNQKNVLDYLPSSPKGSLLYTTNNESTALTLVSYRRNILEVPKMELEEAKDLIKRLIPQSKNDEQKQLAEELEAIPLAIVQACAYMDQKKSSISDYITLYKKSDENKTRLLSFNVPVLGGEMQSVMKSWMTSFESAKSENSRAAHLLSIMSFLDRQGLPSSLLIGEKENPLDFSDAATLLEQYSLITTKDCGISYSMHASIQRVTQRWVLKLSGDVEEVKRQTLNLLSSRFPKGGFEDWETCAIYAPHAEVFLLHEHNSDQNEDTIERAKLLYNLSWYYMRRGNLVAAEQKAEESYKLRQKLSGENDKDTLASLSAIASVFQQRGAYKDAEKLHRRVFEGRMTLLGEADHYTLNSKDNLAIALTKLGEYAEAERLHREVVKVREEKLGPTHPDTLTSVSNLAVAISDQRRFKEAEEMDRRVVEGRKTVLGNNHPDTLTSMNNLAAVISKDSKRLDEAEKLHRAVLEGRIIVLGKDHPDTLSSMNNLAAVISEDPKRLDETERLDEAEKLHRQALEGRRLALGNDHPDTLSSMNNLAAVISRDPKRLDEAEKLHREAWEGRILVLGNDHPHTLASKNNLDLTVAGRTQKLPDSETRGEAGTTLLVAKESVDPDTEVAMTEGASEG